MRLLVMSLLLPLGVSSLLSQMFGSLQSPGFPEPYPPEAELHWNVSAPPGFRLSLYFSHFSLEPSYLCEYDYVKVEAGDQLLGLFCGLQDSDTEQVPDDKIISSPRNFMSLKFSSDFSNEEKFTGFRAHYRAEDIDECSEASDDDLLCDHFCHNYLGGYYCSCRYGYQLHADNHTCTASCGSVVYSLPSGVLSSLDFPAPYPKASDCWFRLDVAPGLRLRLQFDAMFDVEDHPDVICPYDYVRVTAGRSVFGPFCGSVSPGVIQTDSNTATIHFHSDKSGEHKGWRLRYTTTGSQCPVPEAPPHALMTPVQSDYSFQDHVLFTCEPGFSMRQDGEKLDHLQIDCQADGSWSRSPPLCQRLDCGVPVPVLMADLVFGSHDNSTMFGATVQYVCRDGQRNSSFSCGKNGDWIDSEGKTSRPSCGPACGLPPRSLPVQVKRIVGGQSSAPGLFPWQVLLSVEDPTRVPEDRWFGSGALLSESWVLTAAHVLRSQRRDASVVPVEPEHVTVFLGLHDLRLRPASVSRSVLRVFLHPDFQPHNYDSDIALLRLKDPVELEGGVQPVCLPPPHTQDSPPSPPPNSLGVVAGWGISNASSPPSPSPTSDPPSLTSDPPSLTSDLLQFVKLPVVPQDECRSSYASRSVSYNITDNMFCAGFLEGGRDTCLGDSGGAFVQQDEATRRWAAVGLVSWGGPEDCGSQRVYGVYTRVDRYVDWIRTHLGPAP